jgi:hypothetical protein
VGLAGLGWGQKLGYCDGNEAYGSATTENLLSNWVVVAAQGTCCNIGGGVNFVLVFVQCTIRKSVLRFLFITNGHEVYPLKSITCDGEMIKLVCPLLLTLETTI